MLHLSGTLGYMNKARIRLILDDLRSAGNVGSILRTSDACGVELIYACGTTPYPPVAQDTRPAHIIDSNRRSIAKTALGARDRVPVHYHPNVGSAIREATSSGFNIIVLEQTETSLNLFDYQPPNQPLALVLGNEVSGVSSTIVDQYPVLELPMIGQKESLNVAVAAAIALYWLRFITRG